MLSKNINKYENLDTTKAEYGTQLYFECALKKMIISCFTYGSCEVDSHWYKEYIEQYEKDLGKELFLEVYNEQKTFLDTHCTIEHGVYQDGEGCIYNNLIVK